MATYKKRSLKPKSNPNSLKNAEQESTTAEVFGALDQGASVSEKWIEKNQKLLVTVFLILVVGILGYMGYQKYIITPYEKEAADELSFAKKTFEQAIKQDGKERDSILNLALEGIDGKYGFLDIASEYKGTKAGNLANYFAGICYMNQKKFQTAINFFEGFESEDSFLSIVTLSSIGDAHVNMGQKNEGLHFYEKAIDIAKNKVLTPILLFKAGNLALDLQEKQKAVDFFTQIKDSYSDSEIAKDIEKHINKAKYSEISF